MWLIGTCSSYRTGISARQIAGWPCAGCAHRGGREKVAAGTRLATYASSAQAAQASSAERVASRDERGCGRTLDRNELGSGARERGCQLSA